MNLQGRAFCVVQLNDQCLPIDKTSDVTYDNLGRVKTAVIKEGTLTYTSFNKTATVTQGSSRVNFTYGTNAEHCKMEVYENDVLQQTHYYAGAYEEEEGQINRRIHYIVGGNRLVAIYIQDGSNPANDKFYYIATDHQGSVMALINEDGTPAERYSCRLCFSYFFKVIS